MRFHSLLILFATIPASAADKPVDCVVESSLATGGGNIRQFAFDSDAKTYFASAKPATKTDHFTLTFDKPVSLKSISVLAARPNGEAALKAGVLECSTDSDAFQELAKFTEGKAESKAEQNKVKAIRIRVTEDLSHPLVIREITIDSTPKLAAFRFPIEFALDVTDAPELKEWAEKTIGICEREYPKICDLLASEGYKPLTQIKMVLTNNYKGVAAAGGGKITGSVKYFKDHPADIGAMVHETAHCVQNYRARNNPGWLVEGVADYVRFWQYEPGKAGKLNADKAQYDTSYRTTAAFLAYVTDKHDAKLVTKLNAAMREGKYDPKIWKSLTGKSVEELNQDWRESLVK